MILTVQEPVVFANYSLGETAVSRTAAVYPEDSLLFVVENKVKNVVSYEVNHLLIYSFFFLFVIYQMFS